MKTIQVGTTGLGRQAVLAQPDLSNEVITARLAHGTSRGSKHVESPWVRLTGPRVEEIAPEELLAGRILDDLLPSTGRYGRLLVAKGVIVGFPDPPYEKPSIHLEGWKFVLGVDAVLQLEQLEQPEPAESDPTPQFVY